MAKKQETPAVFRGRLRRPLTPAQRRWASVRDLRERLGCSGCAVGVLGLAFSAYWAIAAVGWPAGSVVLFRTLPERVFAGFLALLVLVPFVVCWRHPWLSWLMFIVLLSAVVVWFLFLGGWTVLLHGL
jgi:hypothetical protein